MKYLRYISYGWFTLVLLGGVQLHYDGKLMSALYEPVMSTSLMVIAVLSIVFFILYYISKEK